MAGKSDVVPLRCFARRLCSALVAVRVITAARRPMSSTRTAAASTLSLFPYSFADSPHGRVRTLSHTALDLVHNRPEAVSHCPALVADVVASSFCHAATVGSRSGSDSCVSPVVLAQRTDDRNVQTDWLRASRSVSTGQNSGESQSWDAQDVHKPAPTIVRDDVLKNVWSFADRSQPSAFAEIEEDVPNHVVLRSSITTSHAR